MLEKIFVYIYLTPQHTNRLLNSKNINMIHLHGNNNSIIKYKLIFFKKTIKGSKQL